MRLATILMFATVAGCGGAADLCAGITGTCVSFGKNATEADIQTGLAAGTASTTFVFAAGTFSFTNELTITTDNITIKGAGIDKTILDFAGQTAGAEGILGMNNGFTISDITVENTKGNGIKVVGATGVTYRSVHVMWTNPDNTTHGPYGIYPVQSTNVLVDSCVIEGASDAGIYVGQSEQIVVRNNTADQNVAGIEIENSHFAEVYGNMAHDNTAGLLVFALPGLQIKDTHDVLVHDNMVFHNNTPNFAAMGDIVGIVPSGTGTFVMDASNVEVRNNSYADNSTGNFAIISYLDSQLDPMDAMYYPFPSKVYVHDNTFTGGGDAPDASQGKFSIGGVLAESEPKFPGGKDADIMYDGVTDPMLSGENPMTICIGDNGGATFLNLHFDMLDPATGLDSPDAVITPYQCTLPAVAAVSFPGLQ